MLKKEVSGKGGDSFSIGLKWMEIARVHRILESYKESIQAFRKAQKIFSIQETDAGKNQAILARANEALGLMMRDRGKDLTNARPAASTAEEAPLGKSAP